MISVQPPVPFTTTYWVIPGQLLAGDHPYSKDDALTRTRLDRFRDIGLNIFIDLTHQGDAPSYKEIGKNAYEQTLTHFEYHRMAIVDFGCPSAGFMKKILNLIDASIEKKLNVYLHCRGGIGRTGTVVGCYLVRHGLAGDEAIRKIEQLRRGTLDWHHASPETSEQRNLIKNWKIGS